MDQASTPTQANAPTQVLKTGVGAQPIEDRLDVEKYHQMVAIGVRAFERFDGVITLIQPRVASRHVVGTAIPDVGIAPRAVPLLLFGNSKLRRPEAAPA